METLKCLQGAPSVQMHEVRSFTRCFYPDIPVHKLKVPPDWMVNDANEDDADPDSRIKGALMHNFITHHMCSQMFLRY
jgi:hypothetical protein